MRFDQFGDSILDTRIRIAKVAALDKNTAQACSSVVEHYLDTVGVGGSIPPMPTSFRREDWENQAIQSAQCYSAQPLYPNRPTSLTFSRTAGTFASASATDGYSRSETMNRE